MSDEGRKKTIAIFGDTESAKALSKLFEGHPSVQVVIPCASNPPSDEPPLHTWLAP